MNLLTRLGMRSEASIDKIVEYLHVLPCYLVAVQDYKAKPSKVKPQAGQCLACRAMCDVMSALGCIKNSDFLKAQSVRLHAMT